MKLYFGVLLGFSRGSVSYPVGNVRFCISLWQTAVIMHLTNVSLKQVRFFLHFSISPEARNNLTR